MLLKRAANDQGTMGRDPNQRLSSAETHVFGMIGDGLTTHEIATVLSISTKTVETYKARLKQKLGLQSGMQLTHMAISSRAHKGALGT